MKKVSKKFIVKVDKKLDKFHSINLFPEKVEAAKKIIRDFGFPM